MLKQSDRFHIDLCEDDSAASISPHPLSARRSLEKVPHSPILKKRVDMFTANAVYSAGLSIGRLDKPNIARFSGYNFDPPVQGSLWIFCAQGLKLAEIGTGCVPYVLTL
ncbi:hypothetical protein TNCV_523661 [Trichonephila clavipes]|nr:hypothetical protein TNCV_523661 [Trichonephila clavipes]